MNFFQDLKQKLGKGFEQAGNQSQRVFELSKLSYKLRKKREDLDELVENLGWTVYEEWEEKKQLTETEKIKKSLNEVYELDQEIRKLEEELDRLKNSNITERKKAETVELPVVDETTADVAEKTGNELEQIYLCATCAYQVVPPNYECENCNK